MSFPFMINGIPFDGSSTLPALKYQGASFSRQAVDSANTGRNQAGEMIRDLITQKDKWKLEFVPCTNAQFYALLAVLDNASFTFSYPNPVGSGFVIKPFYCGDRSGAVLKLQKSSVSGRTVALWGNVSVDVIEM